jgi:benzoyl-CoA reductase/2-hydroxyglutaryl-CoA dehydratase subunit BcrC/BadD/HgdB
MTVWDGVKKSVDDIADVAKEVANLLAEKTDEISREGKIKLEIFNLQRRVHARETKLGKRVYDLWAEDPKAVPGNDSEAVEHFSAMKDLHDQVQVKQQELEGSKEKEEEAPEEETGV